MGIDKRELLKRALKRIYNFIIVGLYIPVTLLWSLLFIYFTFPSQIQLVSLITYIVIVLVSLLFVKSSKKALLIFTVINLILVIYFANISATNDKNWDEEVARLPFVERSEDLLLVKNFRHFTYGSEAIQQIYEEKVFDLNKLQGTDFVISYWDGYRAISHTFVIFRFSDNQNFAISLEIRKEKGETGHPLRGMFKNYELCYVFGDEKDLLRLRTKVHKEQTFLYPMNLTVEHSKLFLLDIIKTANSLHDDPQFYHSIVRNCTTGMVEHLNTIDDFEIPLVRKLILNGISDYYAYQLNGIPTDLPFDVLKSSCYVSKIVNRLPLDENFSQRLREEINDKLSLERKNLAE